MTLSPGARLGPYEVKGAIGAGGMGEVFRARDTRLNRDVAIKVLPAAFADDAERLARFTREAQALASLNHPNIATIHGIEDVPSIDGGSGDSRALVMELVEGEDLSACIARGPMPIAEALPIARQIAEALEAAHEQGIVHRDLKPANIKVRSDGTVKVLDFGLAKAIDPAGASSTDDPNLSHSPTLAHPGTSAGMILGTAAYMSPEQAKGKAVDRRTDIWAFGVILHEMLTGRGLFAAEDVSETLAAVLTRDVGLTSLPPTTPPRLKALVRDCLVRDSKQRLRDIGDARLRLDRILSGAPDDVEADANAPAEAIAIASRRRERGAWILAAVATLACVVALIALWRPRDSTAPQRIQFSVPIPAEPRQLLVPEISPDGRWLAFISPVTGGDADVIWIRPIDALEPRSLAGTEGASRLFWSPDSRSIGYGSGDRIYRVSVEGVAPQSLCELPDFVGAAWTTSGSILASTASAVSGRRLFKVPELGGAPAEVTLSGAEGAAQSYTLPAVLPDGRHFLYQGWSLNLDGRSLYVGSLDGGGPPVRLMATESMARHAGPGFLLFVRAGTLFAQRFDARALALVGEPVRIADDVKTDRVLGRPAFSASRNGTLVYRASGESGIAELSWVDRAGRVTGTVGDARDYRQVRLSPDGKRVASSLGEFGSSVVSVLDLGNGVASAVTDGNANASYPVWSPDGQSLVYGDGTTNNGRFLEQRVGSQSPQPLFDSPQFYKVLDDWSSDGQFLLFHIFKPASLFVVPDAGSGEARPLFEAAVGVWNARFSPDGRWIAYQITESTTHQVWVAAFPPFDQRRRVSTAGGGQPVWGRNGQELFYLTPTGKLMQVKVGRSTAGAIDFEAPVELFQSPLSAPNMLADQYAVANDSQRFLFIRPQASSAARPPITVVVNWAAGLSQ